MRRPARRRPACPAAAAARAAWFSSEPHHANINTTGGNYDKSSGKMMMIGLSGSSNTSCTATTGVMRERVRRCLRVYRWQRMQGVWTEWMRETPQAGAPATSLS